MIVRSGTDLFAILNVIHDSRMLGTLFLYGLEHECTPALNSDAKITRNEPECEAEVDTDGNIPPQQTPFGFWLPHGLSTDEEVASAQIRQRLQRFNDIERAFCEVEELQPSVLTLEDEMADYIEAHERVRESWSQHKELHCSLVIHCSIVIDNFCSQIDTRRLNEPSFYSIRLLDT